MQQMLFLCVKLLEIHTWWGLLLLFTLHVLENWFSFFFVSTEKVEKHIFFINYILSLCILCFGKKNIFFLQGLAAGDGAGAVRHADAAGLDALNGASVEGVHHGGRGSCTDVESLLGFFGRWCGSGLGRRVHPGTWRYSRARLQHLWWLAEDAGRALSWSPLQAPSWWRLLPRHHTARRLTSLL